MECQIELACYTISKCWNSLFFHAFPLFSSFFFVLIWCHILCLESLSATTGPQTRVATRSGNPEMSKINKVVREKPHPSVNVRKWRNKSFFVIGNGNNWPIKNTGDIWKKGSGKLAKCLLKVGDLWHPCESLSRVWLVYIFGILGTCENLN